MRFGWVKNNKHKPDAMLTFSIVAFIIVIVKFLLSGVKVGEFSFGSIDASTIGALLGPTLASYCVRRHSDVKYENRQEPKGKDSDG